VEKAEEKVVVDRNKISRALQAFRSDHSKRSSNYNGRGFKVPKARKKKESARLLDPSSSFSEYFRVIRTLVLQAARDRGARVLLVTSSVPGEGKSFVASNLALSIANGLDKSVLLVDADFRKPSIQTTFGFGVTKGLSDYLSDAKYELGDLIQSTSFRGLSVLPAGSCPPDSSELLAGEIMKIFVHI